MEKYILNDTGQDVSIKKKNPLLQPTNVTEENKQHSQTTNSANNIVPIDKIKVNQNNFYELKEKAKKISILHFLTESKTKHRYVCPFCGSGIGSKRTGSIIANSDNTFHCNACSKHGDVIALYMQVKGVDFKTAIEELANDKISYTKTHVACVGGSTTTGGYRTLMHFQFTIQIHAIRKAAITAAYP